MIFLPEKKNIYDNKVVQSRFESLPTRKILAISKERLEELKILSEDIKTKIIAKKPNYYYANHSVADYFSGALQLLNDIQNTTILSNFNYTFNSLEEIGLIIMMVCDNELKYLTEYKAAFSEYQNIDDVRQRLYLTFGFYSPKLYAIELHYCLLQNKLSSDRSEQVLNRKIDVGNL